MSDCSYIRIKENINNACEYVKSNCENDLFSLYLMHYCSFDCNLYITIPVLILILFVCFLILSDTTNTYLSPALITLSDRFNMSQNLTGVTFLVFGNGAPDLIASIVASSDNQGVEMAIAGLMGAGVFVTCIVFSTVVIFSGEVEVNKKLFIRDIILYIITLTVLSIFSLIGSINLWESICFFSLYIM